MKDLVQELSVSDRRRVEAIAQELSKYGLGIWRPHAHTESGEEVALPSGIVSLETELTIRFVATDAVGANASAVGWRWDAGVLSVCAGCCSDKDPGQRSPAMRQ